MLTDVFGSFMKIWKELQARKKLTCGSALQWNFKNAEFVSDPVYNKQIHSEKRIL